MTELRPSQGHQGWREKKASHCVGDIGYPSQAGKRTCVRRFYARR